MGAGESTITVTTSRTTSHDDAKLVSKLMWVGRENGRGIRNAVTVFLVSNNTTILVNLGWVSVNSGDFNLPDEISPKIRN